LPVGRNDSYHPTVRHGGSLSRQVAVVTQMRSLTKAHGEVSGSTIMVPSHAKKAGAPAQPRRTR
jgi:hypothetical protein